MRTFSPLPDWVKVEHQVAQILTEQEFYGWNFNERAAWELASTLRNELEETERLLRERFPVVAGSEFTPKRNNKTQGYVEGATFTKLKETNITSRDHIAWILTTHFGWKPTELTATGKPIIDEPVLKEAASSGITIAEDFLKCLNITKALGMISEGTNAWLKLCTTASHIHHHCSVSTNTFRCAHRSPNLAQVPSDGRFRELFIPRPGLTMVGADLSGIELRMLAHYLARYDEGRYADILLNGDIHQVNADKIGITRKLVKNVTYAFLYGAGDLKIGLTYDKLLSPKAAKAKGKEIRQAYIDAIDGLGSLLDAVKKASERGYVKAIDGRKVIVDSTHKALNYCLQAGAGCVAKMWMIENYKTIKETNLPAHQLAFIHDELQFECPKEHVEDLRTSLVYSATRAGEIYKMRVRIDAEAVAGNNWAETH